MRLFVALNPTAEARQDWGRVVATLQANDWPLRWVAVEALHLTLQFLGSVADERIDAIVAALHATAARHVPFDMHVRGLGAFPNPRQPRVLWLGVEPDPPLLALQRDLSDALGRLGFAAEKRAWSPHVTLARARGDSARISGVDEVMKSFRFDGIVPIEGVDLMKSILARGGARYACIARAVLGSR